MALRKGVFIVAAKRTAFGAYGGKLKSFTPTDLQEIACKAALQAGNVNPEIIDSVYIGSIMPSAPDTCYISRHAALRVGCKLDTPCLTINRLCGSGFQSIVNGAQEIQLGESEVVMTGGSESMSGAPHAAYGTRWGVPLGANIQLEDVLWAGLTDLQIKTPMGITAENLAEQYNISREQSDAYAVQSQNRWKAAQDGGRFKEEMAPITLKSKKGEQIFEVDEHPRPGVTVEQMAKLPAVFKKGGAVNAGNASGVCDGAGCVIVASEEAVKQHNLTPLARLIGYHMSGCDPKIMGIGPVPAIRSLLKKTEKSLDNIDLVEVNEAFAPQYLACEKELGLDPERTNVDGGAIALGHPLAASGSRITAHLVHELRRRGGKYAIGSACIGGGQGIALMLERV